MTTRITLKEDLFGALSTEILREGHTGTSRKRPGKFKLWGSTPPEPYDTLSKVSAHEIHVQTLSRGDKGTWRPYLPSETFWRQNLGKWHEWLLSSANSLTRSPGSSTEGFARIASLLGSWQLLRWGSRVTEPLIWSKNVQIRQDLTQKFEIFGSKIWWGNPTWEGG